MKDYSKLAEEIMARSRERATSLNDIKREAQEKRQALRQGVKAAQARRQSIESINELRFIPGFFPSPKPLIHKMIRHACIAAGMTVLEPSAGRGDIAEELAKIAGAKLSVIEINNQLRSILLTKGFKLVGYDFLEASEKYDRIVMNPPFGNGQDIDHVRHGYECLNQRGRLVSIISEGPFFHSTNKAKAFREWFDSWGGYSEKLPPGTFLMSDRSTGVNTRIITLDR